MSSINTARLEKLCEIPAVSGDEKELHDYLADQFSQYEDITVVKDRLGSIYAIRNYDENKPNIMISTNIDENGAIVSEIKKDGLLKLIAVGKRSIDEFVGQFATLLTRKHNHVKGVIIKIKDEVFLDVNVDSEKKLAEHNIKIGDFVMINRTFSETESTIFATNLMNRMSLEVILTLLEKNLTTDYNLFLGGMTHSLTGERAAITATTTIEPDLAFHLDTKYAEVKDYNGIGIRYFDPSLVPSTDLINYCQEVASSNDIELQPIFSKEATDASFIHKTLRGCPTAVLTIPMQSNNAFAQSVSLKAVDTMSLYLEELINQLDADKISELNFNRSSRYGK